MKNVFNCEYVCMCLVLFVASKILDSSELLFERSEFLIATSKKKKSVRAFD